MIYHSMMPPVKRPSFTTCPPSKNLPVTSKHRSQWFQETPEISNEKPTVLAVDPNLKAQKTMGPSIYQLLWWCFIPVDPPKTKKKTWVQDGPWVPALLMVFYPIGIPQRILMATNGESPERQGTTSVPLISRISSPTWRRIIPPELSGGKKSHRNEQLGGKSHGSFVGKIPWSWEHHGNLLGKKTMIHLFKWNKERFGLRLWKKKQTARTMVQKTLPFPWVISHVPMFHINH